MLSIRPFTATAPALEASVSAPPPLAPVVMFPFALIAIGPVPANSPLPAATLTLPPVPVILIAPLLVTIKSFTPTLRAAVSATAPPATAPRPSICAFTLMSLPAVTLSALPVLRLSTGWLMFTSVPALTLTAPALPSMKASIATAPAAEARVSAPLVTSGPVCNDAPVRTLIGEAPANTAFPARMLTVPAVADRLIAPLLVTMKSLTLILLPAVIVNPPPA